MMARGRGIGLAVAVLAASVVTSLVSRVASADDTWHGATRDPPCAVVDIPAGALPPGPAVLRDDDVSAGELPRATVRFEMPRGADAHVRVPFWSEDHAVGQDARIPFVAESDAGAVWRGSVALADVHRGVTSEIVFLGDPAGFHAFTEALRGHALESQTQRFLSGVRVSSFDAAFKDGCRALAAHALVIAADVTDDDGAALRECASRGANVLFIGSSVAGPVTAFAAGEAAVWGLGGVAWAPAIDASAVRGALDFSAIGDPQNDRRTRMFWPNEPPPTTEVEASWRTRRRIVLALLVLYAGILGPIGYLVDKKARRPWLAWAWLPGVAAGVTGLLAVAMVATEEGRRAHGDVYVSSFTSPDGVGLENSLLHIEGSRPELYRVTLDWHDADARFATTSRYGSPFGSLSDQLELHEDDIRGTMTAAGLGISRNRNPAVNVVQPVRVAVATLERRDGEWAIVNATTRPLDHVELIFGGRAVALDGLAPGAFEPVAKMRSLPDAYSADEGARRANVRSQLKGSTHGTRSYVIVTESRGDEPGMTVTPALPLAVASLRMVIGQIPDGAELR